MCTKTWSRCALSAYPAHRARVCDAIASVKWDVCPRVRGGLICGWSKFTHETLSRGNSLCDAHYRELFPADWERQQLRDAGKEKRELKKVQELKRLREALGQYNEKKSGDDGLDESVGNRQAQLNKVRVARAGAVVASNREQEIASDDVEEEEERDDELLEAMEEQLEFELAISGRP